jgi:hypothetical protein
MSSPLDAYLKRLRDPQWIPHISSYCDNRCAQCAFSKRCWTYALHQEIDSGGMDDANAVAEEPAGTTDLQPERGSLDADDERDDQRRQEKINNDPLVRRVREYAHDLHDVLRSLLESEAAGFPADVRAAVEDAYSLGLTIGAKTHRAVSSFEDEKDEQIEDDLVQNDANGSAKVARLAIVQTLEAWEVISRHAALDPALVAYLVDCLKALGRELDARFPHAMAFVRPGFDEEIPGLVRPWSIAPEEDEDEEDRAGAP